MTNEWEGLNLPMYRESMIAWATIPKFPAISKFAWYLHRLLNYAAILPDFVSPLSSGEENCQPEGDTDEEEGEREQGGLVHWELFVQIKHLEHLFLVT